MDDGHPIPSNLPVSKAGGIGRAALVFVLWAMVGCICFIPYAVSWFTCGLGALGDDDLSYPGACTINNGVSHAAKIWSGLPFLVYIGLSLAALLAESKRLYLVAVFGMLVAVGFSYWQILLLHQHVVHIPG